jgi:hypothetical protein
MRASLRLDNRPISAMSPLVRSSLDDLAARRAWTYRASRAGAAEPAALAALALTAWDRCDDAKQPAAWLADVQQADGSVAVFATETEPRWPTSLAVLAWAAVNRSHESAPFSDAIERAAQWCLADCGNPGKRSPKFGHDPTIVGWSWAENTASWLEPTCFHVLSLSAIGRRDHPRTQEGRRLIVDRLLPDGGANYGNTLVLGQKLVPHPAPTGVAMVALAGNPCDDPRVNCSLDYLDGALERGMTPMSLSWSVMGLTAHNRRPANADEFLDAALADDRWQPLSANEASLLLMAARTDLPWLPGLSPIAREEALS